MTIPDSLESPHLLATSLAAGDACRARHTQDDHMTWTTRQLKLIVVSAKLVSSSSMH